MQLFEELISNSYLLHKKSCTKEINFSPINLFSLVIYNFFLVLTFNFYVSGLTYSKAKSQTIAIHILEKLEIFEISSYFLRKLEQAQIFKKSHNWKQKIAYKPIHMTFKCISNSKTPVSKKSFHIMHGK